MSAPSVEERLARIEAKLDALIEALASEDQEAASRTLDGEWAGAGRDQTQGLG